MTPTPVTKATLPQRTSERFIGAPQSSIPNIPKSKGKSSESKNLIVDGSKYRLQKIVTDYLTNESDYDYPVISYEINKQK